MNQTSISTERPLALNIERNLAISASERLLPLPEVEARTGFKSSFLYQLIRDGKFPKPVKIGLASRWRESEVQQWIHDQIKGDASGKRSGV